MRHLSFIAVLSLTSTLTGIAQHADVSEMDTAGYYTAAEYKNPASLREAALDSYYERADARRRHDLGTDRELDRSNNRRRWNRPRTHGLGSPARHSQNYGSLSQTASPNAKSQRERLLNQSSGIAPTPAHGGFGAYTRRSQHSEPNLSIGPLDLAFTVTLGLDSSDNYFHTESNRESSLSASAGFLVDGEWFLTDNQSLAVNMGIGVDYWLDGPDGAAHTGDIDLNVSPDSQIDYLIELGEAIQIRIYDNVSVLRNQRRSQFSLDEINLADRWTNAAGAQVLWGINAFTSLELGYEYGVQSSFDSEFDDLDRDWQTAFGVLSVTDGSTLTGGIETRASWTTYDSDTRNDADTTSIGAFVQWIPSDYTNVQASLGIERWDIGESSRFPASTQNTFYGSIGISNQLNEDFRHTLSIGRSSSLSEFASFSQSNFVRYGFDWDLSDATRINGFASYARSAEKGGGRNEKLDSHSVGLTIQQRLSDYVTLGLKGSHQVYGSNLSGRSYSETRSQAWLTWYVNEALTLSASYEHWRGDGDIHFEDNRILLGTSISF